MRLLAATTAEPAIFAVDMTALAILQPLDSNAL